MPINDFYIILMTQVFAPLKFKNLLIVAVNL